MDPARTYRYLTTARARVFGWIRPLTAEQFSQAFPIGAGSLASILNHTRIAEWYYVLRILGGELPPTDELVARSRRHLPFPEFEAAWTAQADETRAAIAAVADWGAPVSYSVMDDETGKMRRVTTTPSDIFTQLVLHEVHHRAQVLNILRRLGVKTEDIDYNLLMYTITDA